MENENINTAPAPAGNAKLFAFLSYFGFFWVLGLCIEPEKYDPYVKNHVNAGITLSLCWLLASAVNIIPFLGQFVSCIMIVALMVFSIMGFVQALRGKYFTVPLVGDKFTFVK